MSDETDAWMKTVFKADLAGTANNLDGGTTASTAPGGIVLTSGGGPSDAGAPIAGSPVLPIPPPTKSADELYVEAKEKSDWKEAAYHLNGTSVPTIEKRLRELKPTERVSLHSGALTRAGVGKDSNVGKMTRGDWLDSQYRVAISSNNLGDAAYYMNEFDPTGITTRLNELSDDVVSKLHDAAVMRAGVGPGSNIAKMTANAALDQRKKDDAALQRIGITRQQLIEFDKMNRSDFGDKYGYQFMLGFPDKARTLPDDLLARILPGVDQTKYLQKSGRVSTNADETSRQVKGFKPGSPIGGVVRTAAIAAGADPDLVDSIGQLGDLAEALLPAAAAAAANAKAGQAAKPGVPIQGNANANPKVGIPSSGAQFKPGQVRPNSVNPRDPKTGELNDTNCVPATAAVMKNRVEGNNQATAKSMDPHNVMETIPRAGQALRFVADKTKMAYDEKPVDLKNYRQVAAAQPGHYALIASSNKGAHMVYAMKTESGKFVIYDGQHEKIYTIEDFCAQYPNVAGYRFFKKPTADVKK